MSKIKRQSDSTHDHLNVYEEEEDIPNQFVSKIDHSLLESREITIPKRLKSRLEQNDHIKSDLFKKIANPFAAIQVPPLSFTTSQEKPTEDTEFQLNMKGLNVSFKNFILQLLEKSSSMDMTFAFEKYKKHLADIHKKFKSSVEESSNETAPCIVSSTHEKHEKNIPIQIHQSKVNSTQVSSNSLEPNKSEPTIKQQGESNSISNNMDSVFTHKQDLPNTEIIGNVKNIPPYSSPLKFSFGPDKAQPLSFSNFQKTPLSSSTFASRSENKENSTELGSSLFKSPAFNFPSVFSQPSSNLSLSTHPFSSSTNNVFGMTPSSTSNSLPSLNAVTGSLPPTSENVASDKASSLSSTLFPTRSLATLSPLNSLFPNLSDSSSKIGGEFPQAILQQQHNMAEDVSTSVNEKDDEGGDQEEADDAPSISVEIDPYLQGPGEEGEITIYAVKCKVYCLSTKEKKWSDLGIASLRINKSKESEKPRILIRSQDATGKILLNTFIGESFKPELGAKSSVSFLAASPIDTILSKYSIRVKNEDIAKDLLDKLLNAKAK